MADALSLVAYPDLENRVKAIEEDGLSTFLGFLTPKKSLNCEML